MSSVGTKRSEGAQAAASSHARLMPRQLSAAERALFAAAAQRREVIVGEVIFRRGELGRSMFIVESGEIQLEFGGGMPDKRLGAAEFFGELVLFIGSHARVANAVAVMPAVLLVVDGDAFDALIATEPLALAQFMRRSFSYLVASEQQLIQNLKRRNEDLLATLDSLQQARTQLSTAEKLVQTDELTGLCNRRGLYIFLERLEEHRLPDTAWALLLIDLDRFKQINDRCGHLVGDQVLRAVAEEVCNAAASTDLPCRLGGDEFALLMQVTGEEELRARATQVIAAVRALRFPGGGSDFSATVSVGGSLCADETEWAVWYSDADAVLYEAKGRGGDGFAIRAAGAGALAG